MMPPLVLFVRQLNERLFARLLSVFRAKRDRCWIELILTVEHDEKLFVRLQPVDALVRLTGQVSYRMSQEVRRVAPGVWIKRWQRE
jgi:hypothetical protein